MKFNQDKNLLINNPKRLKQQLAEVVDVYDKVRCCWVRFFEDYDETKADDECTFLFDEVEVISTCK